MQSDLSLTGTLLSHRVLDSAKIQSIDQKLDDALKWLLARNVRVFLSEKERKVTLSLQVDQNTSPLQMVQSWFAIEHSLPKVKVQLQRTDSDSLLGSVPGSDEDWLRYEDYLYAACALFAAEEKGVLPLLKNIHWTIAEPITYRLMIAGPLDVPKRKKMDTHLQVILQSLIGKTVHVSLESHQDTEEIVQAFRNDMDADTLEFVRKQTEASLREVEKAVDHRPLLFGQAFSDEPVPISSIQDEMRRAVISGRAFGLDSRELQSGRKLVTFHVTDQTDSITCKVFLKGGNKDNQNIEWVTENTYVRVRGAVQFDPYAKELTLQINDAMPAKPPLIADEAVDKRVELHAHTQMSALDGTISATDLIRTASEFGHSAVAITDHAVVQAYPEAFAAGKKYNVKVLYGVEINLVDIGQSIVLQSAEAELNAETEYVVFDTETTGLSAYENELIEIAGVKMKAGEVIDTFASLIRPSVAIPEKITEITNITNEMVRDQPTVQEVLPKFYEFAKGCILVAHNAEFDMSFLKEQCKRLNHPAFDQPVIDTLALARTLLPEDRNHRLKTLTQKFNVKLTQHHRALADSEATGRVFYHLLELADKKYGVERLTRLTAIGKESGDFSRNRAYHATVFVKNQDGLKDLYRIVSEGHVKYFYKQPRTPRALLQSYRENFLVGSGCKSGELFQGLIRGKSKDELKEIMKFYDFIELQPLDHYQSLIDSGEISGLAIVEEYQQQLLQLADDLHLPVVATGDVHFLRPEDAIYREIIMYSSGPKRDQQKVVKQPSLTMRTTDEMLAAFSHLGDRVQEVVIHNTQKIAAQMEVIRPVPDRVYPPNMEGADDQVRDLSTRRVHEWYGDTLPEVVKERLDKELNSIITNGFSVNYLIAHKLVTKSLSDGYIVGSRGSVGSSLVATLLDITEVNPLSPHYRCAACMHSEFILDGTVGSGFDLPDKKCPHCDSPMIKDGQDIPFETFLGFKGDKVPDIDLNFSGEYQARAHKYTEELFGQDYVFRAGTISTVADKTAYGYVKKWADDQGKVMRNAEIARLVAGCTGIKRTTGQHPGGLIIVPNDHEIYDFCPIQFPADDMSAEMQTTHFDFHSIHDNLLKLDILGHDDPTVLRMLQELTGLDPRKVPVDDEKVYSLFSGTGALGVKPEDIRSQTGTFGIPEFGTKFVRQMLEDTKPSSFADLVRISGLSHGTDVWLNNAQELIRSHTAPLQEVICCRDDIMVYLIYRGLDPSRAFKIMEGVRKGKGLTDEDSEYMRQFDIPEWYLHSCRKIKYMFPKAHAAAYVLNAVRIAYYKVHMPLCFYAAYFTVRAEDFDLELMVRGADAIASRIEEIDAKGVTATTKEKSLQTVLEVALEMTRRGYHFLTLDLGNSDATKFLIQEDKLLPPFAAAPGIGTAAAKNIVDARNQGEFISIEDLQERARITKTVVELLDHYGCLNHLPESNQLSLF